LSFDKAGAEDVELPTSLAPVSFLDGHEGNVRECE
jgi:hypothetical protein